MEMRLCATGFTSTSKDFNDKQLAVRSEMVQLPREHHCHEVSQDECHLEKVFEISFTMYIYIQIHRSLCQLIDVL